VRCLQAAGNVAVSCADARSASAFTSAAGAARTGALRRRDNRAEPAERIGGGGRPGPVATGELGLEVRERGRGAVAEARRLGDLEVERDAPALHAAPGLDRHELDEAQQLLGAAGLLGA
jgi:hypothetical protein